MKDQVVINAPKQIQNGWGERVQEGRLLLPSEGNPFQVGGEQMPRLCSLGSRNRNKACIAFPPAGISTGVHF